MGFIVSIASGMGLILCAETLIVLGNGVGRAGTWFLICIGGAAAIHLLGAYRLFGRLDGPQDESTLLKGVLGRKAALAMPLAARLPAALVAATSLLATAGYVFNEIFIYWFPNFLFAFILLGLITVAGLAGGAFWGGLQITAAMAAFTGLAVLAVAGLVATPAPMPAGPYPVETKPWFSALSGALLLFIGYDLAFLADGHQSLPGRRRAPAAAVGLGSLILILWGWVSLRWVAPATLAASTIPYTVTARTILGQPGRIIMGIVILAGVCAAVNALFGGLARMMVVKGASGTGAVNDLGTRLLIMIPVAGTAAMLLTGVAGSGHITSLVLGALLLWLLHYAALHLAAWRAGRNGHEWKSARTPHLIAGVALVLSVILILANHDEWWVAVVFMVATWLIALIFGVIINASARRPDAGR